MSATRIAALVAGVLYFSTHVTSVVAVAVYGTTATDPAALGSADAASRVLGGAGLEILLALGVLGTGVVLLPLLQGAAPILANAFSALRTLEAAVIAVGAVAMIATLSMPLGDAAHALVNVHQASFLVGQGFVISVNTLVIATLLVRTGVVPRWIGVLGLVGGVLVLCGNIGQMFGWITTADAWAAIFAIPVFAFEICFATYLVARGLRAPARTSTVVAV